MKKIYSTLACIFCAGIIQAQLTQANHAPAGGDIYSMWHCDSVNTVPGTGAAATVWNYSAMATYSNLLNNFNATSVTSTIYPNASVMVSSSANDVAYYSSTANNLKYYGGNISIGTVKGSLNYTSAAVFAGYPMSLNTTTNSVLGGSINVTSPTSGAGTFTGTCNVLVDGTGTVVLPGTLGTFTNVTRVVTNQTIDFTVAIFIGPISGQVIEKTYNYYMSGIKAPILTILTASATVPGFGTSTQTTVTRNKDAVGIATSTGTTGTVTAVEEIANPEIKVAVFPNPSSGMVSFATPFVGAKYVAIYDVTGKLQSKTELFEGKATVEVSSLNKGLYLYNILSAGNAVVHTGKLTVVH